MTVDLAQLEATYREHVRHLASEYAYVLGQERWDGVLLHSGSLKIRSSFDDQYWPLRVTPHFQHWAPLEVPDCAILVVPGEQPILYHHVTQDFWEGKVEPETGHFWGSFAVVEYSTPAQLRDLLPAGKRLAFVGEDAARATSWGFAAEAHNPEQLVRRLDRLRTLKSRYELLCLTEANRRAALGHTAVREAFLGGDHSELDLHLAFLRATGQDDPETPYKNIVALGRHAATLHHIHYGRRPEGAQSLLLDAGASYQGYDSDVTRTMAKGKGAAVDLYAELVRRLDALQREACRRIAIGLAYERLHDVSHELLAPILRDLGVARAPDDELVSSGVTRTFFPHGLGHSLGLQTHDVGCAQIRPRAENPFLRNTSEIAPGQIFTIEPGCYFIDSLLDELRGKPAGKVVDWKVVDVLRPFGGVRVEDDLAVRDASVENLTRAALGD